MKIRLPEEVKFIIGSLTARGYEAYAVGGSVRDSLLSRTPGDWDVTTSALPSEVKSVFRHTIDTGIAHGTVTVRLHGQSFEVTTYRIDGDYADSRHPDSVTFTRALKEDLLRRDFTINAMAYNDEDGLIDLFGGQADLRDGLIRAVGDPAARFTEDALRIMRCVRFSAQLGFSIETETYRAAKALADTVRKVSRERVREELLKILMSAHPEAVATLQEIGVLQDIFPAFSDMSARRLPPDDRTAAEHTAALMKSLPEDRILRLAALFHDAGKPAENEFRPENGSMITEHAKAGERAAFSAMTALKFDNETRDRVCRILRFHEADGLRRVPDRRSVRHCMAEFGPRDFDRLLDFMTAIAEEAGDAEAGRALSAAAEHYRAILDAGECTGIPGLALTGNDLIRLGMTPGKAMGETLKQLLSAVLDDPSLNTPERLTRIVHEKFIVQNLQFSDKHDTV